MTMINRDQNTYNIKAADTLPGGLLSEADLQNLASCYITPELSDQGLLRRVDSDEGARVGRRGKLSNCAGIIFPYVWPGAQMLREHRLRRDLNFAPGTDPSTDATAVSPGPYSNSGNSPPKPAMVVSGLSDTSWDGAQLPTRKREVGR
jgi:hypothetical protein